MAISAGFWANFDDSFFKRVRGDRLHSTPFLAVYKIPNHGSTAGSHPYSWGFHNYFFLKTAFAPHTSTAGWVFSPCAVGLTPIAFRATCCADAFAQGDPMGFRGPPPMCTAWVGRASRDGPLSRARSAGEPIAFQATWRVDLVSSSPPRRPDGHLQAPAHSFLRFSALVHEKAAKL